MRDHVVVSQKELIQCKNNIVVHYSIDKIDSFSLGCGKTMGFDYVDLRVGTSGDEKVLLKVYKAEKRQELENVYDKLISAAETHGMFVQAVGTTYVNLQNLRKVKKNYDETVAKYQMVFKDGLVLESDEITPELRLALDAGKQKKKNEGQEESCR